MCVCVSVCLCPLEFSCLHVLPTRFSLPREWHTGLQWSHWTHYPMSATICLPPSPPSPSKPDQDTPSPPLLSSSSLTKCSHQSQTWKHAHKQGPWTVNNLLIRHASLRRVTDRKTHRGFWVMGWIFFQINRKQRLTKAVLRCNLFLLTITDIFMSTLAW